MIVLAFLIGIVAGLRAMIAPAAVAFAARYGGLDLSATPLAFMGYAYTPWIFGVLAAGELVTDQLPTTPSRKVPIQFGTRIIMAGLAGAALCAAAGGIALGVLAGVVGAIVGTYGGAFARGAMARSFGSDRPAALIEDAVALIGAFAIVSLA